MEAGGHDTNLRQYAADGMTLAGRMTGYALDCQWIDAPILDEIDYPRNVRGVASIPGLYFLGLLWQHSQASASLVGPRLDGPYVVERMAQAAG
jgi:putative flavoprotein involved in K+ transport